MSEQPKTESHGDFKSQLNLTAEEFHHALYLLLKAGQEKGSLHYSKRNSILRVMKEIETGTYSQRKLTISAQAANGSTPSCGK